MCIRTKDRSWEQECIKSFFPGYKPRRKYTLVASYICYSKQWIKDKSAVAYITITFFKMCVTLKCLIIYHLPLFHVFCPFFHPVYSSHSSLSPDPCYRPCGFWRKLQTSSIRNRLASSLHSVVLIRTLYILIRCTRIVDAFFPVCDLEWFFLLIMF